MPNATAGWSRPPSTSISAPRSNVSPPFSNASTDAQAEARHPTYRTQDATGRPSWNDCREAQPRLSKPASYSMPILGARVTIVETSCSDPRHSSTGNQSRRATIARLHGGSNGRPAERLRFWSRSLNAARRAKQAARVWYPHRSQADNVSCSASPAPSRSP